MRRTGLEPAVILAFLNDPAQRDGGAARGRNLRRTALQAYLGYFVG